MNDELIINVEGKDITLNIKDTLKTLFSRRELLELSLASWVKILEKKDGTYSLGTLYKILRQLIQYKHSSTKHFIYNNNEYWFNSEERSSLKNLIDSNADKVTLFIGDTFIDLSKDKAKKFINDLELYSGKCFINTKKHLSNIKQLKTIEDLINYDYTAGYPEKITLNEK